MKTLVVVRHGRYANEGGGRLNADGREQIEGLGAKLAAKLAGCSISLLSSPLPRARETSEILARHLVTSFEEHLFLRSSGMRFYDGQEQKALQLVEEKGQTHDVVILSSHMEFIDLFPTIWGTPRGLSIAREEDTPKGTARVIDAATGQEEWVRG
jgi:broad specificity phosphatase PhoE